MPEEISASNGLFLGALKRKNNADDACVLGSLALTLWGPSSTHHLSSIAWPMPWISISLCFVEIACQGAIIELSLLYSTEATSPISCAASLILWMCLILVQSTKGITKWTCNENSEKVASFLKTSLSWLGKKHQDIRWLIYYAPRAKTVKAENRKKTTRLF